MSSNFIKKRLAIIIVAIIIGVGVPEYLQTLNNQGESKLDAVKFIRCVDGDTIMVEDANGEQKRVRMIGIDTPESVAQEEERNL